MTSLKEMPTPGDGRAYDWSRFPGHWGVPDAADWSQGPKSPMLQSHAGNPLDNECADGQDGCPLGSSSSSPFARMSAASGGGGQPDDCDTWFAGDVQAALCASSSLTAAIRRADLGRAGRVRLVPVVPGRAVSRRSVALASARTAPGLAQRIGQPMEPGTRLRLDGRMPSSGTLLVRVRDGSDFWSLRFALPAGSRDSTLIVSDGGRATLRLRTGRNVAPIEKVRLS